MPYRAVGEIDVDSFLLDILHKDADSNIGVVLEPFVPELRKYEIGKVHEKKMPSPSYLERLRI